ncbi:hypothetical protein AX15_001201 [Amanita polypyramis BW_CC]|nr:hypothetical protein AX15_001201 [Amanita polypyramis BW_CC]
MFKPILSIIVLFCAFTLLWTGSVHSLCLPCQRQYGERRTSSTLRKRNQFALRTVYNPHITSPAAGTMWIVGSTVSVTWDTSDMPPDITNKKGRIELGYIVDGDESEHLDYSAEFLDIDISLMIA